MNFDPSKFFIGLVDFFSIILPGALFTFLFGEELGRLFLGSSLDRLAGTERWMVFLFASYLFGHFIFLIGAGVLDSWVYDPIRKATRTERIRELEKGEKPKIPAWLLGILSRIATLMIDAKCDRAVGEAMRIKEQNLGAADKGSINAFQWCKAWLHLNHPAALESVHRFEADSKFFRSLVVLLVVITGWCAEQDRWLAAALSTVLMVLAFWRYVDQRVKATNQAYWYVITSEAGSTPAPQELPDAPTHAGGVVMRSIHDKATGKESKQVLFVSATKNAKQIVLPKGHIEPGETPECAAVREVLEEAGVWASIERSLGVKDLPGGDEKQLHVHFFQMEFQAEAKTKEKRTPVWLSLPEAIKMASFDETKELLAQLQAKAPSDQDQAPQAS